MLHLQRATALWASFVAVSWSVSASPVASSNADAAQIDLSRASDQKSSLPSVWPPPQQIAASGACAVRLSSDVTIVTGNATDSPTIKAIQAIVAGAGGKATISTQASDKGTQVFVGTDSENGAAAAAAKALTGDSATGLAAEGYVLGAGKYNGRPTVVLNGADARGTFYAAQTLRQLVSSERGVPGVKVRDWPLMPIRGSIEGFYGIPWSHQARKDQYVFYGQHKMNTYVYTPKSDPYLRATWRELYGDDDLDQLKDLVETANANHVDFTYALSPGLDLCYTSDADFNSTVSKFEQLRKLGVSSFYIALDDIPLEFHCDSDTAKFPNKGDQHWIADAQAYYLNRVQKEYIKAHEGLADLETVPTHYAGSAPDPYKGEFGKQLDKDIRIQWTGEGVFSDTITVESVVRADSTYVTDKLFIWDNFPVNDGKPSRLFLNPLTGRAADLYKHLIGFTSNPMVQSYASLIALGNYGDYSWNSPAYDAQASWSAVIRELAGKDEGVRRVLLAFADINQNWPAKADEEYKAAQGWVEKTKAKTVDSLGDDGKIVPKSITPTTGDGVFDAFIANATTIYQAHPVSAASHEPLTQPPMTTLDGRTFKAASNASNGQVGDGTEFHHHQQGNIVWAEYAGGSIVKGSLIAHGAGGPEPGYAPPPRQCSWRSHDGQMPLYA
ncbi:hypothetical protein LLEC1_00218 [Akanthomyces lecanii]|uniref:GH84 domain-containing protein n=1 Tax=Cordyceps confragosa TaxID=2714763 RepID=A0A179IEG1_CORDF|nr:hypothetical protein LLEC1_00218 [Akanthomyces lecanii]